jgi:hypothetical protein
VCFCSAFTCHNASPLPAETCIPLLQAWLQAQLKLGSKAQVNGPTVPVLCTFPGILPPSST